MFSDSPFSPGSPAYSCSVAVQQKFSAWRQNTRPGSRRIPKDLWEDAVRLAAMTTVYQVSRLLSLDFRQLKTRVIATYGANCSALPRSYKKKTANLQKESVFSGQINISSPIDGFLELPMAMHDHALPHPPILAEISSHTGCILRLFSADTAPIIQAFLRQ